MWRSKQRTPRAGMDKEERRLEVYNCPGSLFLEGAIIFQQRHPQDLAITHGPLRDTGQTTGTSPICGICLHSQSAIACLFLMVARTGMSNHRCFKVWSLMKAWTLHSFLCSSMWDCWFRLGVLIQLAIDFSHLLRDNTKRSRPESLLRLQIPPKVHQHVFITIHVK